MGRMVSKALFRKSPKPTRIATAIRVMVALILSRITKANSEVSMLPTNCTSPVPIRFRNPSTSLMIRETRAPVLLES